MSEIRTRQPDMNPNSEISFGKKMLLFALLCVAGFLGYTIWKGNDVQSSIPRAMQVTYVPADFKMNLDEQKTLEILSNPQRFKQEFDELILNFNTNLVVHVSNRMGLSAQLRTAAVNEYRKMHPYVRQMYFNDFIGLSDTTSKYTALGTKMRGLQPWICSMRWLQNTPVFSSQVSWQQC